MILLTQVEEQDETKEEEAVNFISNLEDSTLRDQVFQDLQVQDNPILKGNVSLKRRAVALFCKYRDIISQHEFEDGRTTEIQCQIQLKP